MSSTPEDTPIETTMSAPIEGAEAAGLAQMRRLAEQVKEIRTSMKALDVLRDQVTQMTVQAMYDEESARRLLRVAKRMQSPQFAAQEYALRDMAERLRSLWAPDRNAIEAEPPDGAAMPPKRRPRRVKGMA
ncbi:hypothetical protein ACPWR0_06130 [Pandoraea pneumonica]|uniref:hypothetical protein n=1 Tax=Pandoraea pneumonica TaxID=2508299 RepID=UPI003CE75F77